MAHQRVAVIARSELSDLAHQVATFFNAQPYSNCEAMQREIADTEIKALVVDATSWTELDEAFCRQLRAMPELENVPIILMGCPFTLAQKARAYELGCDDIIHQRVCADEACARITKAIFHKIACIQLMSRLHRENCQPELVSVESHFSANIQFLIRVHQCDNLDQLGQLFFSLIERYGLRCSLQMRSAMGDKNMEAHGMAKDLESELLTGYKDAGDVLDFGPRTILNFQQVSLLIKNMPLQSCSTSKQRYLELRDMAQSMVQGLNARVVALEERCRMLDEKDLLRHTVGDIYQAVDNFIGGRERLGNEIRTQLAQLTLLIRAQMEHAEESAQDLTTMWQQFDTQFQLVQHSIGLLVGNDSSTDGNRAVLDASLVSMSKTLGMPEHYRIRMHERTNESLS